PITAVYLGTTGFNASPTSNTVNQVVNAVDTTTALVSSSPTATVGQSVRFTATVAATSGPAPASGTVSFRDNGTEIGTGAVDGSGVATYTTSSLAVGSHPMTAVYLGTGVFNGSTSNTLTQTVNPVNTTTSLVSSNPSVAVGQSVTFTATVAPASGPAPASGTVSFRDNGT